MQHIILKSVCVICKSLSVNNIVRVKQPSRRRVDPNKQQPVYNEICGIRTLGARQRLDTRAVTAVARLGNPNDPELQRWKRGLVSPLRQWRFSRRTSIVIAWLARGSLLGTSNVVGAEVTEYRLPSVDAPLLRSTTGRSRGRVRWMVCACNTTSDPLLGIRNKMVAFL